MVLLKKELTLAEACEACIARCKALIDDSVVPGLQYKDQCKQLHRFAKNLLLPLEDLQDNNVKDKALVKQGVASVKQVQDAIERGLQVVHSCASLGRIQAIMTANDNAAAFANVAQDLHTALTSLDLAPLGCDDITLKGVGITLEQLSTVKAPFPEDQQRTMIELRKLSEAMRIEAKTGGAKGAGSSSAQLRELISRIMDGGEMRQLVVDRAMLRGLRTGAEEKKDYVEVFFCDALLANIRELLPDDVEPKGADLRSTIIIKDLHNEDEEEKDDRDEFVDNIPKLVEQLQESLISPDPANARDDDDPASADLPPKKSPQQLAKEQADKESQADSAFEELLAVTSDMPEQSFPLSQAEIVEELLACNVLEPLVCYLDPAKRPDFRLRAAELLERLIVAQPAAAESAVTVGAVAACVKALRSPDASPKPRKFALKSSAAAGEDTFTPNVRAARVLKTLLMNSETAKSHLAKPPAARAKSKPQPTATRASRRSARSSRLTEKIRSSFASEAGSEASAAGDEAAAPGGLPDIIGLLAKVSINEAAPPKPPSETRAETALKPVPQTKVLVHDLDEDHISKLREAGKKSVTVQLMALAADMLEVLCEPAHSSILIAQGGLLAAARALQWDVHPEINASCAMVIYKLSTESPAYLQMALEADVCDPLSGLVTSDEEEEKAAASKALTLLMQGATTTPAPPPALGAAAAADAAKKTRAAAAAPDEAQEEAQDVAKHKKGGGVPTNSLFPLMQLVASPDLGADVDVAATLHTLATAAESSDARRELVDINDDMTSDQPPMYPFQRIAQMACDLSGEASENAYKVLERLCNDAQAKRQMAEAFRPCLAPDVSPDVHQGAAARLAALVPPPFRSNGTRETSHDHATASQQLCSDLAAAVPVFTAHAVATKGEPADLTAISFLAAFCEHCSPKYLHTVVRRDPSAPSTQAGLVTRLVALASSLSDRNSLADVASVLARLVHGIPNIARDVLASLMSSLAGAETPANAANVINVLSRALVHPEQNEIPAELKSVLGIDLEGLTKLLKTVSEYSNSSEVSEAAFCLVLRLSEGHAPALDAVRSAVCKVQQQDHAGKASEQELDGVSLLYSLLGDASGSAITRGSACAMLGRLAPCETVQEVKEEVAESASKLSAEELKELYKDDDDYDPDDFAARTKTRTMRVPMRTQLVEMGCLDAMLEALFELGELLVKVDPPDPKLMPASSMSPRRATMRRTEATKPEASRAPRESVQRTRYVYTAAVKGVVCMCYGEPQACRDAACKALVRVLKTGTPAKKLASADVLQHVACQVGARFKLYKEQAIPGLVALATTGLPLARKAAAEALTNLASSSSVPSTSDKAGDATAQREATKLNLKIEVQRAGAIGPLIAMLKIEDERCVQAAANALYVLAQEEENRGIMSGMGARQALQAVLAKAKVRPPKICDRTRQDCEAALSRSLEVK